MTVALEIIFLRTYFGNWGEFSLDKGRDRDTW